MAKKKPATFKRGDEVIQISGGPKLTVLGASNEKGEFQCSWFDRFGKRQKDWFHGDVITKPPIDWFDHFAKSLNPPAIPEQD